MIKKLSLKTITLAKKFLIIAYILRQKEIENNIFLSFSILYLIKKLDYNLKLYNQ